MRLLNNLAITKICGYLGACLQAALMVTHGFTCKSVRCINADCSCKANDVSTLIESVIFVNQAILLADVNLGGGGG